MQYSPQQIYFLWLIWLAVTISGQVAFAQLYLSALLLQVLEKVIFTDRQLLVLSWRPVFYLLYFLFQWSSGYNFWTAWFYLPLDIFDESLISGNATSHLLYRWTQVVMHVYFQKISALSLFLYYLGVYFLDPGRQLLLYFALTVFFRWYLRTYLSDICRQLEVNIGIPQQHNVQEIVNQASQAVVRNVQQNVSNLFTPANQEFLTNTLNQGLQSLSNFLNSGNQPVQN